MSKKPVVKVLHSFGIYILDIEIFSLYGFQGNGLIYFSLIPNDNSVIPS